MQGHRVGMEESHAGRDLAVPADEGRPVLDEPAVPGPGADRISHHIKIGVAPKQAEQDVADRDPAGAGPFLIRVFSLM